MDLYQAARATVEEIKTSGKMPKLGVCGLCYYFSKVTGSSVEIYGETAKLDPRHYYIGAMGQWTEARMTLLALLAVLSAEDFEEPARE